MSSFYEDASLVVIPSGYKTSKIYAEKPTDGSGDLTFTRASGATRVASNGLIEKVRTNLVLQSQAMENASWSNFAITVSANSDTAPDGTLTADKLVPTASNAPHLIHRNTKRMKYFAIEEGRLKNDYTNAFLNHFGFCDYNLSIDEARDIRKYNTFENGTKHFDQ